MATNNSMAASSSSQTPQERELDTENAKRGVWLVKVPKYLSEEWQTLPKRSEVGRLKISKGANGRPEIMFTVSPTAVNSNNKVQEADASKAPKTPTEHLFNISDIPHQHLAVFSHAKEDKNRSKLKLEGHVLQKGECRPTGDKGYMNLKLESFRKAAQPQRLVQQLDKAVVNFKPIASHKADIEFEQKRKSEGKKAREERGKVADVVFSAFEKHQYYPFKDLVQITNQPAPYLKEILNEYCVYISKGAHKNTWELKPEYRHYKKE